MDMNNLYSRHQVALIRAAHSTDDADRTRHQARADRIAHEIGTYQDEVGANGPRVLKSRDV